MRPQVDALGLFEDACLWGGVPPVVGQSSQVQDPRGCPGNRTSPSGCQRRPWQAGARRGGWEQDASLRQRLMKQIYYLHYGFTGARWWCQ